mgnify:CR=1 FL=1
MSKGYKATATAPPICSDGGGGFGNVVKKEKGRCLILLDKSIFCPDEAFDTPDDGIFCPGEAFDTPDDDIFCPGEAFDTPDDDIFCLVSTFYT